MAALQRNGMLIAFGGIGVGLILAFILLITRPDSLNPTTYYALLVGWGLTALLPLFIGRTAVHLTEAAERQRYHYELSLMAPPDRDLIYTYIGEALRRWAFWLALIIGLIPLLALASPQYKTEYDAEANSRSRCSYSSTCSISDEVPAETPTETADSAFSFAAAAIGLWGVSALAAVLGVKMALALGGRPTLLVYMMTLAATAAVLTVTVFELQSFTPEEPALTLIRNNLSMLLPYVVGMWLMRTSTGYAPRG